MALRNQTAGRVDHPTAPIGGLTPIDEVMTLPLRGETERLIGQQLVRREAVVQLDHIDIIRGEP